MSARLDHVVLWVADQFAALDFYREVVGLEEVRGAEFRAGTAPFPSVRVDEGAIIDLMDRTKAPGVSGMVGVEGSAGHPVNHVCLAFDQATYEALYERLTALGVHATKPTADSFGARGPAVSSFYFGDPDGNVFEARYYAE